MTPLRPSLRRSLLSALTRYLRVTVPTLERHEVVDVIDGAVLEFIEVARRGRIDRASSPAGFLIRLTHRRGIDLARTSRRHDLPLSEEREEGGTGADDLLNSITGEEEVAALMGEIRLAGRHELNQVIRAWLDDADRFGAATVRSVADRLGVSPSTVSRRLSEIREFRRPE